jgi:leader peptidase (prepilin peptidase) / N-methyltransferase
MYMALPLWYLISVSAMFGLIFGSFLNVVIYRVPNNVSLMGRSACPKCDHQIRGYDNIPVLSWLLLGAKCRDCKAPISKRYPSVELFTGVAWAVSAAILGWNPILPLVLFFVTMMIALAMIDFDTMRLPDVLTIPSAIVTAVYMLVLWVMNPTVYGTAFLNAGLGAAVWTGFFLGLWLLTGGRGLGFGDVKLAPTLGLMIGWFSFSAIFVGIMAAFIVGALPVGIAIAAGLLKKRGKVPFGPMMIVGAFVAILWGQNIADWYLTSFVHM